MNRHLTGVMAAVFTATVLITAPAFADHRPGNVVVMGGTIAQTGVRAVRALTCALSRAHSPNRRPRNSRATSADP